MATQPSTTNHNITLEHLVQRGGGLGAVEVPVRFDGSHFNGTGAYAETPLESKAAFSRAVDSAYEIISQSTEFTEQYNDVAYAMTQVVRRMAGGVAMSTAPPFKVPEETTIEIGFGPDNVMQYATIPGDWMSIPAIPQAQIRAELNRRSGKVVIHVHFPRMFQPAINGLFDEIRDHLRNNSIYRGRIIRTTGGSISYVKVEPVDLDKVVYNDDTFRILRTFGVDMLRNTETYIRHGVSTKKAILLDGEPGTGKSLFTQIVLNTAKSRGLTGVVVPPGGTIHDLKFAIDTISQYAIEGVMSVLVFEDIEKLASTPGARAQLLDLIDGALSKGLPMLLLATTNFLDQIDRALLRPGRFDWVITMPLPDEKSLRRLLEAQLGDLLADDIDWAEVYPHFNGYTQSWIVGASESVKMFTISDQGDVTSGSVSGQVLIDAAKAYRPMFEAHRSAPTNTDSEPTLRELLLEAAAEALDAHTFDDLTDYSEIGDRVDNVVEHRIHGAAINVADDNGNEMSGNLHTN